MRRSSFRVVNMEPSDINYDELPLEERLSHKVWRARQSGYNQLVRDFSNSRNDQDECFQDLHAHPETWKRIITDLNVLAQEAGLQAFVKYLELGATAENIERLKNAQVIAGIIEKGIISNKAGAKANAIESLLYMVEILSNPDSIIEQILPYIKNRLPKLVAGVLVTLTQIILSFGAVIIKPVPIIEALPPAFAHADKNVRAEATKLTVELYKWLKDSIKPLLFDKLKEIQQKELTKAFDEVADVSPSQARLTRAQKESEISMEVDEPVAIPSKPVDIFDSLQAVEILSKVPADFQTRVNSSLWKDRKEAMDDLHEILAKAAKIKPDDDYTDLIRTFNKCMRDANVLVVQLAAKSIELMTKSLKKDFHKYVHIFISAMLERNKEKKVNDSLNRALYAVFLVSSLSDLLDPTLATMTHKTPQVKISATNFLAKMLATTEVSPNASQINSIMEASVKLLSESQEPIRQAGTEVIGTLMKITGQRELNSYLEKVDDKRKQKIFSVFESAEVKATGATGAAGATQAARAPAPATSSIPGFKKPPVSIPSKRAATSPAKRLEQPKVSAYGRSFTGRSLASNPSTGTAIPRLQPTPLAAPPGLSSAEQEELNQLRDEKKKWNEQNQIQRITVEQLESENKTLKEQDEKYKGLFEEASRKIKSLELSRRQQDLEIERLNNEIESSRLKTKELEATIEMMKLSQKETYKPFSPGDISSGVNRLLIEHKENLQPPPKQYSFESTPYSQTEEWVKAAEITNQLKARIEKMKARGHVNMSK